MLKYNINGKDIFIKSKPFEGTQNLEFYENQIYKSLHKIGLDKNFIKIKYDDTYAKVNWIINNQTFSFICSSQENKTKNLGAISQAIQDDIRQITRGIKTIDLVMKQYKTNKTDKTRKKNDLTSFKSYEKDFDAEELRINKPVKEDLEEKYKYLLKESNDKLDILYLKFKEECRKHNTPNHPLLKALKIVRQKRGLEL